jgi:hypothetical protein
LQREGGGLKGSTTSKILKNADLEPIKTFSKILFGREKLFSIANSSYCSMEIASYPIKYKKLILNQCPSVNSLIFLNN